MGWHKFLFQLIAPCNGWNGSWLMKWTKLWPKSCYQYILGKADCVSTTSVTTDFKSLSILFFHVSINSICLANNWNIDKALLILTWRRKRIIGFHNLSETMKLKPDHSSFLTHYQCRMFVTLSILDLCLLKCSIVLGSTS